MPRIRSIKPEFWHDRKVARSCSRDARMLYIGLWNHADEHGRANGDVAVVKGQVFPYDDDVDVAALLVELAAAERVFPYVHDGDPFLYLPKLAEHQRLEPGKVASKFPDPPTEFPDPAQIFSGLDNGISSQQVTDESEKIVAESEKIREPSALLYVAGSREHVAGSRGEGEDPPNPPNGGKPKRPRRKPQTSAPERFPITDEMRAWAAEKAHGVDLERQTERFLAHHRSKDSRFADWPQAWRNWMTSPYLENGQKRTAGLVAVWDA